MVTIENIALAFAAICIALITISAIQEFLLNKKLKTKEIKTMTPTAIRTELDTLINQTKGKFFSITFVKNDGTTRIINGKDKYNRLLKSGSDTVRQAGFVPFVNRNTETWAAAHNDRVVTFQCGKLKKEMQVSI
jgi:tRNA splicing ligase